MIKHWSSDWRASRSRSWRCSPAVLERVHLWRTQFGDSHERRIVIQAGCWARGPASMAKPLDQDIRTRILAAIETGASCRSAAKRFGVSESAAIKLMRRYRKTGSAAPGKIGGTSPVGPCRPARLAHEPDCRSGRHYSSRLDRRACRARDRCQPCLGLEPAQAREPEP